MKNSHLKNALIAGVLAVFAGVLLLGANAAIGDAPTYDPPGEGVSPTFTGLTVTDTVDISGDLLNSSTVFLLDGTEVGVPLRINDDLTAGKITSSGIGSLGNLNVDGDSTLGGGLTVGGDVTVDGSVQADRFGTYVVREGSLTEVLAGKSMSAIMSSSDQVISCGFWQSGGFRITELFYYPDENTCILSAKNESGDPQTIRLVTLYLNPSL